MKENKARDLNYECSACLTGNCEHFECGYNEGYEACEVEMRKEIDKLKTSLIWALNTVEVADDMMDDFDREMDDNETIDHVNEIRTFHNLRGVK